MSNKFQGLLVGALAILSSVNSTEAAAGQCKVLPGDVNWPTLAEWDALNKEVEGRLLGPVTPLSAPCHDNPEGLGEYDAAKCTTITENWTQPSLHIQRESPSNIQVNRIQVERMC